MSLEIEKRFKNGGYLFNVTVFHPLKENQIIRTRIEGNKITFTI